MKYQSQFKLMLEKVRAPGSHHTETELRDVYSQNFSKIDAEDSKKLELDLYAMESFLWEKFFPRECFPGKKPLPTSQITAPTTVKLEAKPETSLVPRLIKVNNLAFSLTLAETIASFEEISHKVRNHIDGGRRSRVVADMQNVQDAAMKRMHRNFEGIKGNYELMHNLCERQERELEALRGARL